MKNSKSKHFPARGLISALLSFLMSFFIGVFGLTVVVQCTAMSQGYLKKQIEKSGYITYTLEDIKDSFVSYGLASGFEEDFCASLVTEERVRADLFREVLALFGADNAGYDEKAFEEELYQKLVQNALDRNIAVDEENEKAVRMLAEEYIEVYTGHIEFPVADQISDLLQDMKTPLLLVGGISLFLILFTAVFLFFLYRRKYKFVAYCTYALSGAALLLGLPSLVVLLSGRIARLGVTNPALYFLLQDFLSGAFSGMLITAVILLVLSIVLFFLYYFLRKRFISSLQGEYHK